MNHLVKKLFREFILKGDYRCKTWHQGELKADFDNYMITDFNTWLDNHGKFLIEKDETTKE